MAMVLGAVICFAYLVYCLRFISREEKSIDGGKHSTSPEYAEILSAAHDWLYQNPKGKPSRDFVIAALRETVREKASEATKNWWLRDLKALENKSRRSVSRKLQVGAEYRSGALRHF